MQQITNETVTRMLEEQDTAAKGFWAYPESEWQTEFQATWLNVAAGVREAQDPSGLVWGEWDNPADY